MDFSRSFNRNNSNGFSFEFPRLDFTSLSNLSQTHLRNIAASVDDLMARYTNETKRGCGCEYCGYKFSFFGKKV